MPIIDNTLDVDELAKDILSCIRDMHCNPSEIPSQDCKDEIDRITGNYNLIVQALAQIVIDRTDYADLIPEDGPDSMRDPEALAESIEQDAIDQIDQSIIRDLIDKD